MNRQLIKYFLVAITAILVIGCRQAKYVPEGQYLLKDNEVGFKIRKKDKIKIKGSHDLVSLDDLYDLIKPTPNRSLKLFFYNRIDTLKHQKQVDKKEEKYRKKNEKRKIKENEINNRRREKAIAKGDSLYKYRQISDKEVKLGWREWVRVRMGEPPILLDTLRVRKSKEQMEIYLRKKGFYFGSVKDTIIYKEKKRKAEVNFVVDPGQPYRIREIKFDTVPKNMRLIQQYAEMVEEKGTLLKPGGLLDQDILDDERERYTEFCRNEGAYFGLNKNYIGFVADTTVGNLQADIIIFIKPRMVENPKNKEEQIEIKHHVYRIRHVTFKMHNPDEYSFKNYELYKQRCNEYQLPLRDKKGRYQLLDTLFIYGKGTFIYNEEPFLDPNLLDKQNFLEIDRGNHPDSTKKYYQEYYVERSYRTMSNLGVFSTITPKVEVDPAAPLDRFVVVTYDLMPVKKQSFLFEPRVSNTNGILGILGTISYTNRNLFRGAQQLQISFTGGMESQPLIVGTDETGGVTRAFQLNTFEWGPKISMTFPKLVPLPKSLQETFSKRLYPKTVLDLTVNFQNRSEFRRTLSEFGYAWEFKSGKTQNWNLTWMELNYVRLQKEQFFQDKLEQLNDPFLLNSYTDHLTLLTKLTWHFNNVKSNVRKSKHLHDVTLSGSMSGKALTPLIYSGLESLGAGFVDVNAMDLRQFFGVPYTDFWKFDGQYVASQYINEKHKMVYRVIAGIGFASGNSPSLPYEQAYFAGGSNDIRAFEARTMAPGSTKTYADTNSTLTQIGDMKFEANAEWRFGMNSLLEGAVFVDAGNIWNLRRDTIAADDPAVLKTTSWREVAIGVGYGIRADFEFLIVRLDLSFALHNPHLPVGERWWLTPKTTYASEIYFEEGPDGELLNYEAPHPLRFNFGIGYPF